MPVKLRMLKALKNARKLVWSIIFWSPALKRGPFLTEQSKRLYWRFEQSIFLFPQLTLMFAATGAINLVLLTLSFLISSPDGCKKYVPHFPLLYTLLHAVALLIKWRQPGVFRKCYLFFQLLSVASVLNFRDLMITCSVTRDYGSLRSTLTGYYMLVVTVYFHNSTLLTALFLLFTIPLGLQQTELSPEASFIRRTSEATAKGLFWLSFLLTCLIFHFLINKQLRKTFDEVERSIGMQIVVHKEIGKQESLLSTIFPLDVAQAVQEDLYSNFGDDHRLKENEAFRQLYIKRFDNGFTALSSRVTAQQLVEVLNELFARFDSLAKEHHCMRIKILGDCYYCVSGLYDNRPDHAICCVEMGLQMIDVIRYVSMDTGYNLSMRVGVHTGSVLCGLIGLHKWQFDVWSQDINLANQLEATGEPGYVHISDVTFDALHDAFKAMPAHGRHENMKTFLISPLSFESSYESFSETRLSFDNETIASSSGAGSFQSNEPIHLNLPGILEDSDGHVTVDRFSKSKAHKAVPHPPPSTPDIHRNFFSGNYQERRQFGVNEISSTLATYNRILRKELSDNEQKEVIQSILAEDSEAHTLYVSNLYKIVISGGSGMTYCRDFQSQLQTHFKDPLKGLKYANQPFHHIYYFLTGLLVMCFMHYLGFLLILPHRVTVHVGYIVLLIFLALVLVTFSVNEEKLPGRFFITFTSIIKTRRIVRYIFFFLLWVSAVCVNNIGLSECNANAPYPLPYEKVDFTNLRCDLADYHVNAGCLLIMFIMIPFTDLPVFGHSIMLVLGMFLLPLNFLDVLFVRFYADFDEDSAINEVKKTYGTLLVFVASIAVIGTFIVRQFEQTRRVNYLQKQEILNQYNKIEAVKAHNFTLLNNLLPNHVVNHFINPEVHHMNLYSDHHEYVGVMFASIPTFSTFYEELEVNKQGIECMRILNEIIADFDQLLKQHKYSALEKIKTIGSTYMVASGLKGKWFAKKKWKHLCALVEFSQAMRKALRKINKNCFNNFNLRIGISHGPVVAGVIGAKKPQYDIWGDTVNVASRMDGTGVIGRTQVTSNTKSLLEQMGYEFELRGVMPVKGKGELVTFLLMKEDDEP